MPCFAWLDKRDGGVIKCRKPCERPSKSNLTIFNEAAIALGVKNSIKKNLPKLGSNCGFKLEEYILPLTLMLCGGGKEMKDIGELKNSFFMFWSPVTF